MNRHSKYGSASVSTNIYTILCYQIPSFRTKCFGSVRANNCHYNLGTCPLRLGGEMLPSSSQILLKQLSMVYKSNCIESETNGRLPSQKSKPRFNREKARFNQHEYNFNGINRDLTEILS